MPDLTLRLYSADDRDWLVDRHQTLYTRDEAFDDSFGPLVDSILRDFEQNHDPTCECGWIAEADGQRLGSIFCVRQGAHTAKLRLFLLMPEARGRGLGKRMLTHCMGFARDSGYHDMALWTHESHKAARALYRSFGWRLTGSKPVHSFGVDLVEQSWAITL